MPCACSQADGPRLPGQALRDGQAHDLGDFFKTAEKRSKTDANKCPEIFGKKFGFFRISASFETTFAILFLGS